MPTSDDLYLCLNRGTCGGTLPLEQFVKLAADAGFAGADVDLGYAEQHGGAAALADLYAKHGIRAGAWGLGNWRGSPADAEGDLAALDKHAAVAAELGIDACATWLMPSSDKPLMENWAFHVDRLGPCAKVLAGHGLRLGLEFVAPYHLRRQGTHEFIFTPGQMLELAAAIGPNVGLLVDCFHVHCAGSPMGEIGAMPAEKIVVAHLNDAPALPIPEIKDGERLLPGEGGIDLSGFITNLRAAGYKGPLSLEVFNADLRALPPAEAAHKAFEASARYL